MTAALADGLTPTLEPEPPSSRVRVRSHSRPPEPCEMLSVYYVKPLSLGGSLLHSNRWLIHVVYSDA